MDRYRVGNTYAPGALNPEDEAWITDISRVKPPKRHESVIEVRGFTEEDARALAEVITDYLNQEKTQFLLTLKYGIKI